MNIVCLRKMIVQISKNTQNPKRIKLAFLYFCHELRSKLRTEKGIPSCAGKFPVIYRKRGEKHGNSKANDADWRG